MEQLEFRFRKPRGRRKRVPLETRFWAKVDKNGPTPEHMPHLGPCWIWTAAVNPTGYGVLSRGGEQRAALHLAHRLSWQLHHCEIAGNMFVCHHCDTPACVRPDHLFLGTCADNLRDMREKRAAGKTWKRPPAPERKSRLTEEQVREIRARLADGYPRYSVAARFGITTRMVGYIIDGRYWSHVA